MEPWQKSCIRENLPELIECTTCSISFITKLHAAGVLSGEEFHRLSDSGSDKLARAQHLYSIVQTRSDDAFFKLKQALADTNQTGAYQVLENAGCEILTRHQRLFINIDNGRKLVDSFVPVFEGYFGIVPVSVKVVSRDYPLLLKAANNGIEMLANLGWHEHIIRYWVAKFVTLGNQNPFAIVLDSKHRLDEYLVLASSSNTIQDLCQQVIKAVAHLHWRNIVHLNLHPKSIFVCSNNGARPQIKLAEFGVAQLIDNGNGSTEVCIGDLKLLSAGSYFTPEVLEWHTEEHYPQKRVLVGYQTDTFCTGVILYYLLSGGYNPFGDILFRPYFVKICKLFYPNKFNHVEENIRTKILEMLSRCPQNRPVVATLLN